MERNLFELRSSQTRVIWQRATQGFQNTILIYWNIDLYLFYLHLYQIIIHFISSLRSHTSSFVSAPYGIYLGLMLIKISRDLRLRESLWKRLGPQDVHCWPRSTGLTITYLTMNLVQRCCIGMYTPECFLFNSSTVNSIYTSTFPCLSSAYDNLSHNVSPSFHTAPRQVKLYSFISSVRPTF